MKKDIIKRMITILCSGVITSLCVIGNTSIDGDYLNPITISCEEEQTQVDKILEYGRSKLGSTAYNNYCQRFVRECYEYAGIKGSLSVDCAFEGFQNWCVSTSADDIPVGAVVYFKTSEYGHAGIYTGNNKMLHGVSTVKEEEISDHYWSCYLGWGYQYGIEPTGTYLTDYQNSLCSCTDDFSGFFILETNDGNPAKLLDDHRIIGNVIAEIPSNSIIEVTMSGGGWYHVKWNGYEGYYKLDGYLSSITVPRKPEISIELGTSTQETIISWNEDYIADCYSIIITNTDTNECVFSSTDYEDTSISCIFNQGNYSVDIIAKEIYYDISIPSDTVEFTIPKGQLLGDLNSSNYIDLVDVILLKRYLFDAYTLTEQQLSNADINSDENVNIVDYSLLKQEYITNG